MLDTVLENPSTHRLHTVPSYSFPYSHGTNPGHPMVGATALEGMSSCGVAIYVANLLASGSGTAVFYCRTSS